MARFVPDRGDLVGWILSRNVVTNNPGDVPRLLFRRAVTMEK